MIRFETIKPFKPVIGLASRFIPKTDRIKPDQTLSFYNIFLFFRYYILVIYIITWT
ncbi:hypothetical protein HanRHA438_Chr08g0363451 [Helianthus annuus]|nr:hypothetical protein HanRHA438_Chr08g0363451 [Helianthus annuus]